MYFAEVGREHQKSKTLFRNPNEPTFFFPRAEPSGSTTGCSASAGINEDVMEIRCNKWLWAANALDASAGGALAARGQQLYLCNLHSLLSTFFTSLPFVS